MSDTTSKDLREGVRAVLVDLAVATTAEVFFSKMPTAPDRAVVVTIYPVPLPNVTGIQVRVRGKAGSTVDAEDRADTVRDALHGLENAVWGNTRVELLAYVSGARLGFDAGNRDEVALNFHATTSAPSTSLID